MPRRSVCGLVVTAMIAALLAACSSSGNVGGANSFTLWSMWSKGEPGQKVVQQAADEFTKKTGIKVNIAWKGRTVAQSVLPTLNTPNPPLDLVESSNLSQVLAPTGQLLDLSSFYGQKLPDSAQTVGGVLGDYKHLVETSATNHAPVAVPYWISTYGIYYNGMRFPGLKTTPPTTWGSFFETLDAQKAKGVRPLALDGSVPGYNDFYLTYFVRSIMGDGALTKAMQDKTGSSWSQPGILQAARMVEKLAKQGYFIKGYDGSKFPAMEDAWANNQSDFIMMGTWLPEEVAPAAAHGFSPQVFPIPAVDGHAVPKPNVDAFGFAIPKRSKHISNAEKFVKFMLTKPVQQSVATIGREIPVRKDVSAPKDARPLKALLDKGNMVSSESTRSADTGDFFAKVLDPLDDQLIFGKITAAQFVSKMRTNAVHFWKSR